MTDLLPRHLLTDQHFTAACEGRDIGTVFALAHSRGASYQRLAAACGMRPERVSKMARGKGAVTSLPVLERVADGLHIPGHFLGLADRPWEAAAPSAPPAPPRDEEEGADPMKRRDVLRGALAAGLAGPGLAAVSTTRHSLDAALTADHSPSDLGYWEATAERYAYGYHGRAPADVATDMLASVTELRPLLAAPQSAKSRTALCRAAAQLTGMVAIVLHDLGQHREAHAWFHTARRAAAEAGDPLLHAWVLGREAMVPLNYGAAAAAAKLADQARHLAGTRPSAAAALATAVAARAHATEGNRDVALAAIAAAEDMAEALTDQQQADTWVGYPGQKHGVHMSQALTLLGETGRAHEAQQHALELTRTPSLMTRALIDIDHATCRLHDGAPDEAAHIAASAFGALPETYRSGLTHTRALSLYQSLPKSTPGREDLAAVLPRNSR